MANHEKLYGVCENKCFVEVRPKSDTYSKNDVYSKSEVYSKDNFIVIEGTTPTIREDFPYDLYIPFSELGIEATDKLIVISQMYSANTGDEWWMISSEVLNVLIAYDYDELYFSFHNRARQDCTIDYRVVLMKL